MFCNFCGKEIKSEEGLCPNCGETTVPMSNTPAQPPQPVVQVQPMPEPKKKSKLPLIIVAVLVVAAIIAGVIFVPGLLKKDENKAEGDGAGVVEAEKPPVEITCISAIGFDTILNMELSVELGYNEDGYPSRVYMVSDGESTESRAEYDEETYVYTTETYENGTLTETSVCECDEYWRDLKCVTYVDGVETSSIVYEYNEAGEPTKETHYEGGAIKETITFEYDANGKLIKEATVKNGVEVDIISYTYDADGKLTKKAHEYEDGIYTEHAYNYDANGLCSKVVYYEDGMEAGYDVFVYDENGVLTSRETYMMGMKVIIANITYTTVKVKAKHAEALEEKQGELLQEMVFFS